MMHSHSKSASLIWISEIATSLTDADEGDDSNHLNDIINKINNKKKKKKKYLLTTTKQYTT